MDKGGWDDLEDGTSEDDEDISVRHSTITTLIDTANKAGFTYLDLELNLRPDKEISFKIPGENFDTDVILKKEFPSDRFSYSDLDQFGTQIVLPPNLKDLIPNDVGMSGDFQFQNRYQNIIFLKMIKQLFSRWLESLLGI